MANKKISALTELATPADGDILPITDVSDTITSGSADGTTKGVTVASLMTQAPVQSADIDVLATQVSLGNHEALTSLVHGISAFGATLVDDADAAAARTTLGLGSLATESEVEGTAVISTGETGATKFLREDGDGTCSWQLPSADVDGPLTIALRGTDNPHIGAYPNQSFKVTDNPYKSVMVIADADGNLEFLTKDGANVFVNTPSSRLALAKGFSIQADGAEPDIEAVDTDGTTYSVISGDTDTKGANGLPTRQGFNLPDIGANPAPLLISGGTIA